jgi:hypothetical protein
MSSSKAVTTAEKIEGLQQYSDGQLLLLFGRVEAALERARSTKRKAQLSADIELIEAEVNRRARELAGREPVTGQKG